MCNNPKLQKMMCNNPKLDLVNMNAYIKFGENMSSSSQDIERKPNFSVNRALDKLALLENLTIALLQCFAYNKRPEFLRILSGNLILTSIKGHNSLTNL